MNCRDKREKQNKGEEEEDCVGHFAINTRDQNGALLICILHSKSTTKAQEEEE